MDAPMIDSGDTAFMILCTGLVLLMTLPVRDAMLADYACP